MLQLSSRGAFPGRVPSVSEQRPTRSQSVEMRTQVEVPPVSARRFLCAPVPLTQEPCRQPQQQQQLPRQTFVMQAAPELPTVRRASLLMTMVPRQEAAPTYITERRIACPVVPVNHNFSQHLEQQLEGPLAQRILGVFREYKEQLRESDEEMEALMSERDFLAEALSRLESDFAKCSRSWKHSEGDCLRHMRVWRMIQDELFSPDRDHDTGTQLRESSREPRGGEPPNHARLSPWTSSSAPRVRLGLQLDLEHQHPEEEAADFGVGRSLIHPPWGGKESPSQSSATPVPSLTQATSPLLAAFGDVAAISHASERFASHNDFETALWPSPNMPSQSDEHVARSMGMMVPSPSQYSEAGGQMSARSSFTANSKVTLSSGEESSRFEGEADFTSIGRHSARASGSTHAPGNSPLEESSTEDHCRALEALLEPSSSAVRSMPRVASAQSRSAARSREPPRGAKNLNSSSSFEIDASATEHCDALEAQLHRSRNQVGQQRSLMSGPEGYFSIKQKVITY